MSYPGPVLPWVLIAHMGNGKARGDAVIEKRGLEVLQVSTPNLRRPYLANALTSQRALYTASIWGVCAPKARNFEDLAPRADAPSRLEVHIRTPLRTRRTAPAHRAQPVQRVRRDGVYLYVKWEVRGQSGW